MTRTRPTTVRPSRRPARWPGLALALGLGLAVQATALAGPPAGATRGSRAPSRETTARILSRLEQVAAPGEVRRRRIGGDRREAVERVRRAGVDNEPPTAGWSRDGGTPPTVRDRTSPAPERAAVALPGRADDPRGARTYAPDPRPVPTGRQVTLPGRADDPRGERTYLPDPRP